MKGFWQTSINNGDEYSYFMNLLRTEWKDINTKVSPYVEIFPDKKGGYVAFCSKKANFSDWHYCTAKLSAYRHKKKVKNPLFSYIWNQIIRINTIKEHCIEKYTDIPEEILQYLDHDKEALLELHNKYYKKEDHLEYTTARDLYGIHNICGSSLEYQDRLEMYDEYFKKEE